MKKIYILFPLLIVSIIGIICFNTTTIKVSSKTNLAPANSAFIDQNFYNCVVDNYNRENNASIAYTTSLTDEQLLAIRSLNCSDKGIENVKGLEKLINLQELHLDDNNITELDVSKNTKLIVLYVDDTNLTKLDLSYNVLLSILHAYSSNLIELDVSNNTELTSLDVRYNNLTELNVSSNIELISLDVGFNDLTELDVSKNIKLTDLRVIGNNLTELNVSQNIALKYLHVEYNKLTELDVSQNTSLNGFSVEKNNLKKLKISNLFDMSKLGSSIGYQYGSINYIDLGNGRIINPIETYEFKFNNRIVIPNEISIEGFINNLGIQNLEYKIYNGDTEVTDCNIKDEYILKIYSDDILIQTSTIFVHPNDIFPDVNFYRCIVDAYNSKNNANIEYTDNLTDEQLLTITTLSCREKEIENVKGIETILELTDLDIGYNGLTEINLNQNTRLQELDLESNRLIELDISNNIWLRDLDVNSNPLKQLDVNQNTRLIFLNVGFTDLTELDLSHNTLLQFLYVLGIDNLKELDVSQNKELVGLNLGSSTFEFITVFDEWNVTDFLSAMGSSSHKLENQINEETTDGFVGSGYKVKRDSNQSIIVIKGDVTGDGKIKMGDVMKVASQVITEDTMTEDYYLKAADITGDGQIKMGDVMKLANIVIEGGKA